MTQLRTDSPATVLEYQANREMPERSWWFRQPRQSWVILGSLGFLCLVTWADFITAPGIAFSYCFAAPVLAAAWFVKRPAGYLMAVICVSAWMYSEVAGASTYHNWIVPTWNAIFRTFCLLGCAKVLSDFRELSTRLDELVKARTRALQLLADQLTTAEDRERRRLALSIHDEFGQTLTVLKLNLATALPMQQSPEASAQITNATAAVSELIQRTRSMTFDLHPAMLDHFGLVPTLRRFAQEFSSRANVELSVNEEGQSRPLPEAAANYLFRSVKELVNNAVKHGEARQIIISVYWTDQSLRLVVDDDGRGFDAEADKDQSPKGLGLLGIEERLRSFGGEFGVDSTVGKGTRAIMELPVSKEEKTA
jgi:signal transduction histidine kinase